MWDLESYKKYVADQFIVHEDEESGLILTHKGKSLCSIYREVDGYWVVDGSTLGPGAYSGPLLIALGIILEQLNHDWNEAVKSSLGG